MLDCVFTDSKTATRGDVLCFVASYGSKQRKECPQSPRVKIYPLI